MAKIINTAIKKEVTKEEFEKLYNSFIEEIQQSENPDQITQILVEYTKALTPAKMVHVFELKQNHLQTKIQDDIVSIKLDNEKGLIGRCLKTQEPQVTNDIRRDPYYDENIDNTFSYELKNLLIMPLFDEEKKLKALIWAGIPKNDINQFIAKDIKYLQKLTSAVPASISLLAQKDSISDNLLDEESRNTTFFKKISSIFSRLKK